MFVVPENCIGYRYTATEAEHLRLVYSVQQGGRADDAEEIADRPQAGDFANVLNHVLSYRRKEGRKEMLFPSLHAQTDTHKSDAATSSRSIIVIVSRSVKHVRQPSLDRLRPTLYTGAGPDDIETCSARGQQQQRPFIFGRPVLHFFPVNLSRPVRLSIRFQSPT